MTAEELVESSFVSCSDLHLSIFELAPTLMRNYIASKKHNTVSPVKSKDRFEQETMSQICERFSPASIKLVHCQTIEYMIAVLRIEPADIENVFRDNKTQ